MSVVTFRVCQTPSAGGSKVALAFELEVRPASGAREGGGVSVAYMGLSELGMSNLKVIQVSSRIRTRHDSVRHFDCPRRIEPCKKNIQKTCETRRQHERLGLNGAEN